MTEPTRRVLLAAGVLLAPALVRPCRAEAAEAEVTIDNFAFMPAILRVTVGTTVSWLNHDDIPHTVTSSADPPLFRSHPLDTGDRFALRFERPGSYSYFCSLHPHMTGAIEVT
jgi:plastocyanin